MRCVLGTALAVAALAHPAAADAAPPANDAFAAAATIAGTAGTVTGTVVDATKESGEPDHAGWTGGASVWYRWTAPVSGGVGLDTVGSGFTTLLAVYTGTSVSTLTLVAARDPYTWNLTAASFRAVAGTTYWIAVDGPPYPGAFPGPGGPFTLNWYPAPANDDLAWARTIAFQSGTATTDSRGATTQPSEPNHGSYLPSGGSIWYRWVAPVSGRFVLDTRGSAVTDTRLAVYTGSMLSALFLVAHNDDIDKNDSHSVLAFDAFAGVSYAIAVAGRFEPLSQNPLTGNVVLNWKPGPANDLFAAAQTLTGATGSVAGTTEGASAEAGEPSHGWAAASASVWYRWTAPTTGRHVFAASSPAFTPLLAAYAGGAVASLTPVAKTTGDGRVAFLATAGTSYSIAVDAPGGAFGSVTLTWRPGPANDDIRDAQALTGLQTSATGTNVGASAQAGEPGHAGQPARSSVWFYWTAPTGGYTTIDTVGSDFNTVLAVYDGAAIGSLTLVASDDDSAGSKLSRVGFSVPAGARVTIAVDGAFGHVGNFVLRINAAPSNDAFGLGSAYQIHDELGTRVQGTIGATKQANEPDHAGETGGASVWYAWQPPGSGMIDVDTVGSDFDTVLAVYRVPFPGADVGDLELLAEDDNGGGGNASSVAFKARVWELYYIAVDGVGGATGKLALNWGLQPTLPPNDHFANALELVGPFGEVRGSSLRATSEQDEPRHSGMNAGRSVWYSWTAPWDGPLSVYLGGGGFRMIMSVYTGPKLSALTEVATTSLNSYFVQFDATAGTTYYFALDGCAVCSGTKFSGPIFFTWELAPENDDFADAEALPGASGLLEATTIGATKENGEPAHAGDPGGASIWYRWTAPVTGYLRLQVEVDSWGKTLLAVYTGATLGGSTMLDAVAWTPAVLYVPVAAGTEYRIAVDHEGGRSGRSEIRWSVPGYTAVGSGVGLYPASGQYAWTDMAVWFSSVTKDGVTTVAFDYAPPPPPVGYAAAVPAAAFDLATTATVSGSVDVCLDHSWAGFTGAVHLFRRENGAWVDRTTSYDAAQKLVCGQAPGLGSFAAFVEDGTAPVTQAFVTRSQVKGADVVTVDLVAADPGSGVRELRYAAAGPENIDETAVLGDSAAFTIPAYGETTIAFWATDNAGNVEEQRSITILDGEIVIIE